ncbi:MAG: polysaccharide biosynthesis C-terminal domain-containing protein [Saprospiraceae bacterium]|nr:polysaccharide biosynthesis C-terminal domain-containing protein [Saprospiraceae bacterium]
MEIIQKQSLQSSTIHLAGAIIGALSTIFIYPLDLGLYGIYGFLTNTASLVVPFITLGFGSVLLRYFPYYNFSKKNYAGFFGFIFSGYALGILIFCSVFLIFYPEILSFLSKSDDQIKSFVIILLPLTILYVIFELCNTISINFQQITIPALVIFIMKLLLPILFIFSVQNILTRFQFSICICLYYVLAICWLILYLKKKDKLFVDLSFNYKPFTRIKQMLKFAGFSILGGASAILALRIDSILVTSFIGAEANGQFTLAIFICNVAYIPATALTDSLNAVVSAISKNQDNSELQKIYTKSSRNMFIPTLWIAMCIYVSFLSLSQLMPNTEKVAYIYPAIGWLLLARIIDAMTGVNHHILSYSKYYTLELYLLLLMAILNIILNYVLLPIYGIHGAAFATFASVCIYNILKTWIVYLKLGLHPFSKETFQIAVIGIGYTIFILNTSFPFNAFANLLIYSGILSILFLGTIYYLNLSPDFNQLIISILKKLNRNKLPRSS